MDDASDDEDLKRAIAMSLQDSETQRASAPSEIIDLVGSDDEDEELRQALALSLQSASVDKPGNATSPSSKMPNASQSAHEASSQCTQVSANGTETTVATTPQAALQTGFLGLDRKAMEQERLARVGKRKRSVSPSLAAKKPSIASSIRQSEEREGKSRNLGDDERKVIQYPRGTVKRTWAVKRPRDNDIKIEEVFQARTLNIAVLSAFQSEDAWIFDKIEPEKIKQIWIMDAKDKDLQNKLLQEVENNKIPNFRLCFAPLEGQAQHVHSKLMLLFHGTHLRVVIPSANVRSVEWGETGNTWQPGVLENSVFLIDIPRREDDAVGSQSDLTWFGKELLSFVEAQKLGKQVVEALLKFDYSKTGHLGLVHSIPGSLTEKYIGSTGLASLSNAVKRLGLDDVDNIELDYAASSLGALKEPFLFQLHQAARGKTMPARGTPPIDFLDHIRIYFPSQDTVKNSTGGPGCGGIITLSARDYNGDAFPRKCMREYKSTRPGMLSHNKILLARGRKRDGTAVAWAYVGSANLSESAWGSQKILKSGQEGKLSIRNWECGILIPVPKENLEQSKLKEGEVPPMSVFRHTLDIPFEYPGERYGAKQPWFFRD